MAEGRYLLVDVREPNEVAVDAYPGAVVVPLSSFDPQAIPDPQGKQVVFACRSGKRSVTASLAAQAAGLAYDKHLAGGMLAWKGAGLPTNSGG
jgi:rhodanese-related sulfurtransferase